MINSYVSGQRFGKKICEILGVSKVSRIELTCAPDEVLTAMITRHVWSDEENKIIELLEKYTLAGKDE